MPQSIETPINTLGWRTHLAISLALCAWVAVVGTGWAALEWHSNQPGVKGAAPEQENLSAAAASPKYRLLMFVHPRCPCSVASMREFERLIARCDAEVDSTVYFFHPESAPDDWVKGSLWDSASRIKDVRTELDPGGKIASRYGSRTSGDVLLYDPDGRLRYHGGITSARGHEGDSLGKSTVIAAIRGSEKLVDECPVFGCEFRRNKAIGNE